MRKTIPYPHLAKTISIVTMMVMLCYGMTAYLNRRTHSIQEQTQYLTSALTSLTAISSKSAFSIVSPALVPVHDRKAMLEQSAKKHHVTITDFTALSPSDESMRYHLTVTADLDGDIHTFLHNILHQHGGYVGLERYAVTRSENQAHATIDFAIYGGT